jgi:hypothetical protein
MKAIILATLAALAVAGAVTVAFRRGAGAAGAATMLGCFLAVLPILVVGWLATPADLGFLPAMLLAEPPWFDLAASVFFYGAAFFGGLLQLYNLADRGLSLQLLAELDACASAATLDDLARRYSDGRGLRWMYGKRLDGLVRNRLVVVVDGQVELTARGSSWAGRFTEARRWLCLPTP